MSGIHGITSLPMQDRWYDHSKEYGGPGRSFLEANLVVEEMAAYCGPTGRIAVEANMGAISRSCITGQTFRKD